MAAELIDVPTAQEMIRLGDAVIDVRSAEEYASGHIAGALNVPIDRLPLADLPTGPLITTCSMGGRGGRAAELLTSTGRTAFSRRGTKAWQAAGLPITLGTQP